MALPGNLLALIGLALVFDYLNGFHGASNIVATLISSRAIGPRTALFITSAAVAIGPFLFGVAVARTLSGEIVADVAVRAPVLSAGLAAAIGWSLFTWFSGIPASSSHALIGGLVGATLAGHGLDALKWAGLGKVALALLLSPTLGLLLGFLAMKIVLFLARGSTPRINAVFKRGQLATALALSLSVGTIEVQKAMGMIVLGLTASGALSGFDVPLWVTAISAAAFALGASTGGWRLIRTLGGRLYSIRPVHGFTAQMTSAAVILGAALVGGPVSATHVVSSAILGVGSAERLSKVRWGVAQQIAAAWLLTIPMSALLAAGVYAVIR